jgi:hypothetical protein
MTGKDSAVSRSVRLNKVDHIANNCYEVPADATPLVDWSDAAVSRDGRAVVIEGTAHPP